MGAFTGALDATQTYTHAHAWSPWENHILGWYKINIYLLIKKNIAHVQHSSLNGAVNTRMQNVATLVLVMATKYNEHTARIQTDLSTHCINKNIKQYWQRSILHIIKLTNTDIHCSETNITRLFPQTIFDIHQHMM